MFIMSETDSRVNLYQMQLDDVEVEQQKVLEDLQAEVERLKMDLAKIEDTISEKRQRAV